MKMKGIFMGLMAALFLIFIWGRAFPGVVTTKTVEARMKTMANKSFKVVEVFTLGIDEPAGEEDALYQFYMINSVSCDLVGNIYVLDEKAVVIKVFDRKGKFLRKMLRVGKGPNEIVNVARFTINPFSGNLFVLQEYGFTIKEFDAFGNFIRLYRLPEQFFYYFKFIDKDHFAFISVRRVNNETADMTVKVLNLNTGKIEHSFAPGRTDNALRVFQRFALFKNHLWVCPGDKMELTAYSLDTHKQIKQIPVPGKQKENIVRTITKGGLRGLQPIYFNLAQPFSLNNQLFIVVILQDYKLPNNTSEVFPESSQLALYHVSGETIKKVSDLPGCDDMKLATASGNRLILFANDPYPHVKVFEIIEN